MLDRAVKLFEAVTKKQESNEMKRALKVDILTYFIALSSIIMLRDIREDGFIEEELIWVLKKVF